MKKIRNRSFFAMLIAAAMVFGLGAFVFRLWYNGGDWAMLPANQQIFYQGVLNMGTLTDRNGIILASAGEGVYRYAEDELTRAACLHTVGDYGGFIGTGALTVFRKELTGYDFVNGANSLEGTDKKLSLTIDSKLNRTAYAALNGRRGAVVVTDYETGEILCMVSSPSYDPNTVIDSSAGQYEGVYINRAISSAYPPGSVFKIVTLAAAIENIPDFYERSFYCGGSVTVGGEVINCTGTHGSQTIEQAFANSCNCAFSELSQELGGEVLEKYARALGLMDALSVSGIETAAGRFDIEPDGSADLSWSGIGQNTDLVTPLAMARLAGAVAEGGVVREPSLIKGSRGDKAEILSADTAERLSEMMNYNVAYSYGENLIPNAVLHAKTGTAEVGDGSSHGWFVGFITGADRPLAFAVVVEQGGSGIGSAAPVAAQVINAALAGE